MACRQVGVKPLSEIMWNIANLKLRNKLRGNPKRNALILSQVNAFEMSSAKWRLIRLSLNEVKYINQPYKDSFIENGMLYI